MSFKKTIFFIVCCATMTNAMEPRKNKAANDCTQVCTNAAQDCCKIIAKSCCFPMIICIAGCLFHSCECPEADDGAPIGSRINRFNPSTPSFK